MACCVAVSFLILSPDMQEAAVLRILGKVGHTILRPEPPIAEPGTTLAIFTGSEDEGSESGSEDESGSGSDSESDSDSDESDSDSDDSESESDSDEDDSSEYSMDSDEEKEARIEKARVGGCG